MPPLELGLVVLGVDRDELALQDANEEVAAAARRFEEARVDPLGLAFHEVEHRFDQMRGGEHLPVVGNAGLGLDKAHGTPVSRRIVATP